MTVVTVAVVINITRFNIAKVDTGSVFFLSIEEYCAYSLPFWWVDVIINNTLPSYLYNYKSTDTLNPLKT